MSAKGLYKQEGNEEGLSCDLVLMNDSLYLYLNDAAKNLLIWKTDFISNCEWQEESLKLTYAGSDHHLYCAGEMAQKIYALWQYRNGSVQKIPVKRNYKSILLITLIGLFICSLLWLYVVPWLGEKSAAFVPLDVEISLGKALSESLTSGEQINDSASYYTNRFIEQLKVSDTYPIKAEVINSEEINAFAMPGGALFIYSGIIKKMNSYEELVALLGHEISHVQNQHSLKSICRAAASGIVLSAFIGDASGMSSSLFSQINQFKQLDYSRELETEADQKGLDFMISNKADPKGMLNLLFLLKKESHEEPGMMKYLSTHPDTDSRIHAIIANRDSKKSFESDESLQALFLKIKSTCKAE